MLKPPAELVIAVLAKEGFAVEGQHRHAVVPGLALGDEITTVLVPLAALRPDWFRLASDCGIL